MKEKSEKLPRLGRLANAAFLQASYKVVELAKRTGTPVITMRDGRVQAVSPDSIVLPPLPKRKPRTDRRKSD